MLGIFESIGPFEVIIILAIVLLLFGARRLPEIARSLGRSSREFKKGMREGATDEEIEEQQTEEAKKEEARKTD